MDPVYKAAVDKPPTTMDSLTPLPDRIANFEAMTLALAVENNISMAAVPKLIEYAKAACKDRPAVEGAKLGDKQTASYKMVYGLATSLEEPLLAELRTSHLTKLPARQTKGFWQCLSHTVQMLQEGLSHITWLRSAYQRLLQSPFLRNWTHSLRTWIYLGKSWFPY
ncbi:hypothetical protein BaRGS_00021260 [Batillaria attramentaria]|uniref:BRO1 domain-containing protein n=1 Tax=Batillaria attramentaria TaxID=370345 RepID=A0ABD0KKB3_9CAEN